MSPISLRSKQMMAITLWSLGSLLVSAIFNDSGFHIDEGTKEQRPAWQTVLLAGCTLIPLVQPEH